MSFDELVKQETVLVVGNNIAVFETREEAQEFQSKCQENKIPTIFQWMPKEHSDPFGEVKSYYEVYESNMS